MGAAGTIGFGIIGLGMIAEFHTRAIAEMAGCCFAAGFDAVPGRADSFCAANGGKAYSSLDAFLADPDIDIVTVATPSALHLDSAIAAIRAGKHLIVEKPLEITVERCDRIIAEAAAHKVKLGTVFPSRYFKSSRAVKQAIDEGRLGKIVLADAHVKWYRDQEYYDSRKSRGTLEADGGGALMSQGIHAVDLLQWFMGNVTEVFSRSATLAHKRIEVEDTVAAVLQFANGAMGTIEATTCAYPGFLKKIEICGSKGSIIMEEENITAWQFDEERPEDEEIRRLYQKKPDSPIAGGASDPSAIDYRNHRYLFEAFVDAVQNDRPFEIDGQEGRKSVEIVEGIYRSARSGKPQALPF
ncbi:oxidoreductase [Spirochaetia bacterium]|nr:oxidoreductase [Spirochaetia bacterium]